MEPQSDCHVDCPSDGDWNEPQQAEDCAEVEHDATMIGSKHDAQEDNGNDDWNA